MAVIQIDIWNAQSSTKAKDFINKYFNIRRYIITMNINPDIPQYKNFWKQGYIIFIYYVHGSRCVKYNSSHKLEHYKDTV